MKKNMLLLTGILLLLSSLALSGCGGSDGGGGGGTTTGKVACTTSENGKWELDGVVINNSTATFENVSTGTHCVRFTFSFSGVSFLSPGFTVVAGKTTVIQMKWTINGSNPDWTITTPVQ